MTDAAMPKNGFDLMVGGVILPFYDGSLRRVVGIETLPSVTENNFSHLFPRLLWVESKGPESPARFGS